MVTTDTLLAGLGAVVRGADFIDTKGLAQLVQRSTSQEATTGPVVRKNTI